MKSRISRRQFIERLATLGLGAGGVAALSACGARPTPELARIATSAPTATAAPATATAAPTPAPTQAPTQAASATNTPAPTQPPTAAPTETATQPPTKAPSATPSPAYLAVVRGANAAEITRRAVAAIGGIERFVKPGANVIIKPNICNAYHTAEYASTTNPEVVATLVELALGAGAKRVRVMDFPFGGTAQAAYATSGIEKAVKAAGGQMEVMNQVKYREIELPKGRKIKKWTVYGEVLDADVVINVPIAKHHGTTGLTLAMKNLMGVVQDRAGFHARGLHQCIADLCTAVQPQLTVIDAVRILVNNGPTGGDLNDVKQTNTVIASADMVAADAYATTLFNQTADDIGYIKLGAEMGIGTKDLKSIKIAELSL